MAILIFLNVKECTRNRELKETELHGKCTYDLQIEQTGA